MFADNIIDNSFNVYQFVGNSNIDVNVGKNISSDIFYDNQYVNDLHFKLNFKGNFWELSKDINSLVYVNGRVINGESAVINNGDVINVFGLKIVVAFTVIFINNSLGNIRVNNSKLVNINLSSDDDVINEEITDEPLYKDDDYFLKSPRIRR